MPATATKLGDGVQLLGPMTPAFQEVLTPEAVALVAKLHRQFNARRLELLERRKKVQADIDAGKLPDFLPETRSIRESDWKIKSSCGNHWSR
jgi:malate synthase